MHSNHKQKRYYTISVTSNLAADKTKYYRARFNILRTCVVAAILIAAIGAGLTWFQFYTIKGMSDQVGTLREIVSKQESQILELGEKNAELNSKNEILLATVGRQEIASNEQAEIDAQKAFPSAFPLTDSATFKTADEDEDTKNQSDEPIVVFSMSDAADVVASGNGTVLSVREDLVYGNCILIDHGNGYVTYYHNAADPKVSEGDEVVRGAILFVGGLEDNVLGYQITYEGEFIDPLEIMEING